MDAKLPWPLYCYDEHPTENTKNHRHPPSRQLVYTTVLEAVYVRRSGIRITANTNCMVMKRLLLQTGTVFITEQQY
jgi:hypothetical protein